MGMMMSTAMTMERVKYFFCVAFSLTCLAVTPVRGEEPPIFAAQVAAKALPVMAERIPEQPRIIDLTSEGLTPGLYGGDLRIILAAARDIRQMSVYGYARLVTYDKEFRLVPDILERFEVEGDRIFTFHLRKGHRWSDGHPFTTEDFRYYWEDIANERELSPVGPPVDLLVDGEPPKIDIIDAHTIRYSWTKPNPEFLAHLAGATPLFLYRPAHYLKKFHIKYAKPEALEKEVEDSGQRNWAALHNKLDEPSRFDNPDMPTLEPWINTTHGMSDRYVFQRNPYFHRVDNQGRQLPYIDRVVAQIADGKLIPAKAAAGEADLQGRNLRFDNYTVLKKQALRGGYDVHLWRTGRGAQMILMPNLNTIDPVWAPILRDVRFRRALSLGINRHEINQVIFYGLGIEGQNTVLPTSPLYREKYRTSWANYDPAAANKLLDEMGFTKRDSDGYRLMTDGQRLQITIETTGESTEETDVLELISDSWQGLGIKLFIKPSQRESLRNRVYAGETIMSAWFGVENGLARAEMSPIEFAPADQDQFQWPKWGQFYQTKGRAGEAPDTPAAKELMQLLSDWRKSTSLAEKTMIWHQMLRIHSDELFNIGIVAGALQPIVVNKHLRNVPSDGIWNWDPGAHFGIYRPDTFWFADEARRNRTAVATTEPR